MAVERVGGGGESILMGAMASLTGIICRASPSLASASIGPLDMASSATVTARGLDNVGSTNRSVRSLLRLILIFFIINFDFSILKIMIFYLKNKILKYLYKI